MLDNFKEEQKIPYKILMNAIKNNKLSHAYLFETNGYAKKKEFLVAFAKALLCPHHHTSSTDCSVCDRIDKNIYSELKIIEPDGMWIKKEQLMELQEEFKTKSVESDKKVYIINNVECLNTSSANSILKFLEEPEDNIIAILATDNIHSLLDTIISRCQVITLTRSQSKEDMKVDEKISFYLNEKVEESEIIDTLDYIYYLETNHLETIIYNKKLVLNKFEDRKKLELFFDIMILFYKDVLNYLIKNENDIFDIKDIEKIAIKNDINKIQYKINLIMEAKNNLKINANTNLLLDKLVMDLEGDNNG